MCSKCFWEFSTSWKTTTEPRVLVAFFIARQKCCKLTEPLSAFSTEMAIIILEKIKSSLSWISFICLACSYDFRCGHAENLNDIFSYFSILFLFVPLWVSLLHEPQRTGNCSTATDSILNLAPKVYKRDTSKMFGYFF